MGLRVTVNEGQFTITDGKTIVQRYFNPYWKENKEEALRGGDYAEVNVSRGFRSDDGDTVYEDDVDSGGGSDFDDKDEDSQPQAQDKTNVEQNDENSDWDQDGFQGQDKPNEEGSNAGDKSGVGKDDNDPHAAWYLNESYPGVDKFSYGISWHGYWKRTLQQLDEQFRSVQMNWKKREEYHWLIAQFKHLKATNKLPVTNVIALGIGSLHDSPHKEWRRHGEQLAAVLTIRETLGEAGKPLPCIVQDPAYSQLDQDYLRSLGLEPVDDPDAFSRIDAGSLVFHISTYLFIAWWICDGDWPIAMICSDWGNSGPYLRQSHPSYCAPAVHAMFQEYDHIPFIDDTTDDWKGVNIYWRTNQIGEVIPEGSATQDGCVGS